LSENNPPLDYQQEQHFGSAALAVWRQRVRRSLKDIAR
jgi:hypothetical protein